MLWHISYIYIIYSIMEYNVFYFGILHDPQMDCDIYKHEFVILKAY